MIFEDVELVHRNDVETDMFGYEMFNLLGERFGAFTVVNQVVSDDITYTLLCSCGTRVWKTLDEINEQRLVHCDYCALPKPKILRCGRTGRQRILSILAGAIQRCHNPKSRAYPNYGGRGIRVCQEWRDDPESYYIWALHNGYDDDLTLDRIDNYKGYEKTNCRWVTQAENNRNQRRHQDAREGRIKSISPSN